MNKQGDQSGLDYSYGERFAGVTRVEEHFELNALLRAGAGLLLRAQPWLQVPCSRHPPVVLWALEMPPLSALRCWPFLFDRMRKILLSHSDVVYYTEIIKCTSWPEEIREKTSLSSLTQ